MKWEFRLQAGERWDVSATGQYIGYVSGAGEVEILVDGEPHYLGVNEVYQANEVFDKFTVRNASDVAGDIVIKTGMGRLIMSGDGQLTEVLGIRETVKTEVLNAGDISTPIVSKLASFIGSVINIREITETIKTQIIGTVTATITGEVNTRKITEKLDIRAITETLKTHVENTVTAQIAGVVSTLEKPASRITSSQKTFNAGESYEILANTNRRDVTIFAAETNTDLVTVAGIPLAAGQYVELKNYVGSIGTTATAADSIIINEVIK